LKRRVPFEYLQDVLHKTAFKGSPLGMLLIHRDLSYGRIRLGSRRVKGL